MTTLKIGDKVRGFKYEDEVGANCSYVPSAMDRFVGVEGVVSHISTWRNIAAIDFGDCEVGGYSTWSYPLSLAEIYKVDPTASWEVGQEVWSALHGEGTIVKVGASVVAAKFKRFDKIMPYFNDGRFSKEDEEPLLFAEKPDFFAAKKETFAPSLIGKNVLATCTREGIDLRLTGVVVEETETTVKLNSTPLSALEKADWEFDTDF